MLTAWVNQKYLNPVSFKSKFRTGRPFPHLVFKNFFAQEKLLIVLQALAKEQFKLKDSDLFTFFQTNDFKNTNNKVIRQFRDFLASKEFVDYLSQITGNLLQRKIDCFGTIYPDTGYLLPHDDSVENRKIAYMIYFSNFTKKDGGVLNLYSSRNNKPIKIIKTIIPKFNTFVFFEVSKQSFHSVSEVVGKKQRITITGWFYD